jgi:hypothetical protein
MLHCVCLDKANAAYQSPLSKLAMIWIALKKGMWEKIDYKLII